jgi:hypothetical protein
MAKIPGGRVVAKGIIIVDRHVAEAIDALNLQAAAHMTKGRYDSAEAAAERARQVRDFRTHVQALRAKWKEILNPSDVESGASAGTPMWAFYRPILQALVELDGQGDRPAIESRVESAMRGTLTPRDLERSDKGEFRWQAMIRRARRHLAGEGWIEPGGRAVWRLTRTGAESARSGLPLKK